MNVMDLIKELQRLDGDSMVIINGYEGGVNEVNTLERVVVALNIHTEGWLGSHEIIGKWCKAKKEDILKKAIHITSEIGDLY